MIPSSVPLSDLRNGKEAGLTFYMSKYGSSLRFFAYSIVKDKGAAEEIVSDSFYKLWNGRERTKTEDNVRAFLYLSTRNACYDYVDLNVNRAKYDSDALDMLIQPDQDFEAQIIYNELLNAISKELEKLPATQAKVFKMSFFEGLETKEICDMLDTTPSTVYFAKSKAIQTLKEIFKEKNLKYYSLFLFFILNK